MGLIGLGCLLLLLLGFALLTGNDDQINSALPDIEQVANTSDLPESGTSSSEPSTSSSSSASPSSSSAAPTSSLAPANDDGWFRAGYWASYTSNTNPPPFEHYDVMFWFSVAPDENGGMGFGNKKTKMTAFVTAAHKAKKKVLLSVGGWSGSKYFSKLVKADQRAGWITKLKAIMEDNDFDGLEFDWEYPSVKGDPDNLVDKKNDIPNYLAFLKDLRKAIGAEKVIAAATAQFVFSENGSVMDDVSEFASVFDYINIMTYDSVTPTSDFSGPNIALDSKCAPKALGGVGDMKKSVNRWIEAGMPAEKILAGVPFYAYNFRLTSGFKAAGAGTGNAGIYQAASGGGDPHTYVWRGVKALIGKSGWTDSYDDCSDTPYLHSSSNIIPYDNAKSIAAKAAWAKSKGLKGVFSFAVDQDDSSWTLSKAMDVK